MPIYRLTPQLVFPPVEEAEDGVLAVGGDLRPERLMVAYTQGIFPWYHDGLPIIWHSPDPRCVLFVDDLHVSRSMRKFLRKRPFQVSVDQAFSGVMRGCKEAYRPGQDGTWITDDMEAAYNELHRRLAAHSVEVWQGTELVGGLYGVNIGGMFFGESMFSRAPNASKVALVALVLMLKGWGYTVLDCQVANDHTVSLGASNVRRKEYLKLLRARLPEAGHPGSWKTPRFHPEIPEPPTTEGTGGTGE